MEPKKLGPQPRADIISAPSLNCKNESEGYIDLKGNSMDAFWLIPVGILVIVFFWVFYAHIKKQPESPSNPRVLVDKPSNEPSMDQSTKDRDWEGRPCGSFLDWLRGVH